MLDYFVYVVVFFILAYVIFITFNAINKGLELNKEKKSTYIREENYNSENNYGLADETKRLNKLHNEGSINDEEFKKAKEKILK